MDRGYDRHWDGESSRRPKSRSPRRERRRDSPERSRRSRSPAPKRDRDDRSRSPRRDSDKHTRRRSRSRSRDRRRRRRSRLASSSSSSEDSDAESSRKKKRRKEKDRERSRSRDGSRERRKEKKRLKREKKERKKQKKNASAATGGEWGKYGIISESDIYNKDAEFRAWLVEERMLNPETLPKDKTRKEFMRFVEDFNTATLPHEKFYHIEAYERRMSAMRSGDTLPPTDGYDFEADIKAHKSTHKIPEKERESYLSREQLQELRKVQNERVEAGRMKRLGMEVKQNMGVRMDTTFE